MASPTSSVGSSACPERCVAWLEGFYKAPGALWRPHDPPAPFLSGLESLLLPLPNLPPHGMHALVCPHHRRALCPDFVGVTTGIRPYARCQCWRNVQAQIRRTQVYTETIHCWCREHRLGGLTARVQQVSGSECDC